ncbi:MAG: sigma-70 family RNA polymerase sigma factor [Candidatus Eisenbacteria bacterium]|nr:sigma-70 family RNA polymerase sigma factor [Candidatus Eisenbacteria bacterium]
MEPKTERTDEELVRRCLAGDRDSFAFLVDRHKDRVFWLVRRTAGNEEAEDLTQETFLRAYRALPRFRGESLFGTWLYTIARNIALSHLRKRSGRGEAISFEEEGEEKIHLLAEGTIRPEEAFEEKDLADRVRALVERLPEPYRTVITLYHLHQLRYEEIAAVMDLPLGTVKTNLHRARKRLRDLVLLETGLRSAAEGKGGIE